MAGGSNSMQGGVVRRDIFNSLYLMLFQGVNQLLPMIVIPYLMIQLGSTGYGYVGYAFSLIQYLVLFVDFGFNLSATKRVALVQHDKEALRKVFWSVVAAKAVLLLVATLALWLFIFIDPVAAGYSKAIWCTYPMVVGTAATCLWYFQGIGNLRIFSILNALSKLLCLPLIFFFIHQTEDYTLAALLQSMVYIIAAVATNIYLWKQYPVGKPIIRCSSMVKALKESVPFFFSSASTSVYTQLIVIVLGWYCTTNVIGMYTAADRLMRAACFLLYVPINQVFYPKISMLSQTDRSKAFEVFRSVRWLVIGVMLLLSVCLYWGGNHILHLLGKDYQGIEQYLSIFALVPLMIGVGGVHGQMGLVALGGDSRSSQIFMQIYVSAAILSLIGMFLLIPHYGATAACWLIFGTELYVAVLMYVFYKQKVSLC